MDNHSVTSQVRIRYKGTDPFYLASLIHTWRYDDVEILRGPIVGAGGEKDYLKNQICHLFGMLPQVFSITMLTLNGVPFLVMKLRDGRYLDAATQREVDVRKVEPEIAQEAAA